MNERALPRFVRRAATAERLHCGSRSRTLRTESKTTCRRVKAPPSTLKRTSGRWSAGQKGSHHRGMAPDGVRRRFAPPQGGDRWRHRHSGRSDMLSEKITGQAPCRDAPGFARFGLSTGGRLGLSTGGGLGLGVLLAKRMPALPLRWIRTRRPRRHGRGLRAAAAARTTMVVRQSRDDSAQQVACQAERSDPATRGAQWPHDQ